MTKEDLGKKTLASEESSDSGSTTGSCQARSVKEEIEMLYGSSSDPLYGVSPYAQGTVRAASFRLITVAEMEAAFEDFPSR